MRSKRSIFLRCCYGYGVSGTAVLVVGAILPSLMREASLNYTIAGGLLSMMAIGNMLASFVYPFLAGRMGKRTAATVLTCLVPLSFLILTTLPSVWLLYVLMFAAGLARGSITIINNATVNVITRSDGKALNLLHCSFAIGAFIIPFLTALMLDSGLGWRSVIYLIIFLSLTSTISYSTMNYDAMDADYGTDKADGTGGRAPDADSHTSAKTSGEDRSFLRNPYFYAICMLLFFYVGTENCINGWFVTYLQNTGIMSEAYATSMVSVTWLTIMFGRLACAALAKRLQKSTVILISVLGSSIAFVVLIFSSQLVTVTAALVVFGFFLSGIYPTSIADAGQYTKSSALGMSMLTAISALGGILTPQLIGTVADYSGMVAAFGLLGVNTVLTLVFAAMNFRKNHFIRKQPA